VLVIDTINFGAGWFPDAAPRRDRGDDLPARGRAAGPWGAPSCTGFYKRAQIAANDLVLAGAADFADVDALTVFADDFLRYVPRLDGVLVYDDALGIDRGERLKPGSAPERKLWACTIHTCEQLARRPGIPPRTLDTWLWEVELRSQSKALAQAPGRERHQRQPIGTLSQKIQCQMIPPAPVGDFPEQALGRIQLEHLRVEAAGLEPELQLADSVWPFMSVAHQPDRPSTVIRAAYTSSSDADFIPTLYWLSLGRVTYLGGCAGSPRRSA
jgi:hypothetical protein